jgi:hypothetical protein
MSIQNLAIQFAQRLDTKLVYGIKADAIRTAGSRATAYRYLNTLTSLGLAKTRHGNFQINTSIFSQPTYMIEKLLPSAKSLLEGRRFGRYYNNNDVNFARSKLKYEFITLDYKAWELTKYQHPSHFYAYVNDIDNVSSYLKNNGFREGMRGHVILLPMIGNFTNEIERVYLDCIAIGGRGLMDAIAIELLYKKHLRVKGKFDIELIQKVQGDLPIGQNKQQFTRVTS